MFGGRGQTHPAAVQVAAQLEPRPVEQGSQARNISSSRISREYGGNLVANSPTFAGQRNTHAVLSPQRAAYIMREGGVDGCVGDRRPADPLIPYRRAKLNEVVGLFNGLGCP